MVSTKVEQKKLINQLHIESKMIFEDYTPKGYIFSKKNDYSFEEVVNNTLVVMIRLRVEMGFMDIRYCNFLLTCVGIFS
jgi:hypothetical protein